jgi:hypothetical protein
MPAIVRILVHLLVVMAVYPHLIQIIYDILQVFIGTLLSCHIAVPPLMMSQLMQYLSRFMDVSDIILHKPLNDLIPFIHRLLTLLHID